MNTIWKATITVDTWEIIAAPRGAKFLSAGEQNDRVVVWYACDDTQPLEERHLLIVPTGGDHPGLDRAIFIDTVQIGGYVVHVFERKPQ